MKPVSYKVAKAIKEAGYPQGVTPYEYVTKDYATFKEGEFIDSFFSVNAGDNVVDAPYVMEVWLWLWEFKDIHISVKRQGFFSVAEVFGHKFAFETPEESIAAAIDFIVDSGLV